MNNQMFQMVITWGAIIAIFYFVLFRPQQKQKKEQEAMIMSIKKGDEIVTVGGVVGDVVHVKAAGPEGAPTLEDRLTIRSGESRLIVERGRVARVVPANSGSSATGKAVTSGSTT